MSARGFDVIYRNPGHWDIVDGKRLFCIRGEGDAVWISDERLNQPTPVLNFRSVQTAMAWICDELMSDIKA